ncbi:hypothetical protein EVAR_79474_1 [Eumeta japonica]|uniref:Uncharacterized protein n=1 Tax=Eumeta variegata TaxID=151549 RepID=A0A4C1UDP7_EUMVA|nr:hypothetical protein EVAR_79474_1 [Eumeta japonica]
MWIFNLSRFLLASARYVKMSVLDVHIALVTAVVHPHPQFLPNGLARGAQGIPRSIRHALAVPPCKKLNSSPSANTDTVRARASQTTSSEVGIDRENAGTHSESVGRATRGLRHELNEYKVKWSPPPMDTHNVRGITDMLPAIRVGIGYLMKGGSGPAELSLAARNATT